MNIRVGDYQITSDTMQFIVNRIGTVQESRLTNAENVGKETTKAIGYMEKFDQVLKFIPNDVLKTNDDINIIMDKLNGIQGDIQSLKEYPVIFIKEEKKETNKINIKKRLELINSMEVAEVSASNGEIEYISVENNDVNKNIISALGIKEEEIKELLDDDEIYIDITSIGFEFSNSYNKENGFYNIEKEEVEA